MPYTALLAIFHQKGQGMKLKMWALVAEVAASLAVIFSLFLLVVEVRENTKAVESQIARDHHRSIFSPYISPPILLSAIEKIKAVDGRADQVKAFMETYNMSDAEAYAFTNFQLIIWVDMQQDFINNGPSSRLKEQIQKLVRHPDVSLFLEHSELTEAFSSYIESVMLTARL
jgi:hypothetical protein